MLDKKSLSLDLGQGFSINLGLSSIRTWKNDGRPKKVKIGTLGFNTETNSLEYWDGTNWYAAEMEVSKG